jgi:hypothetical protein
MREECKDCNKSLEDCNCIEDTIEFTEADIETFTDWIFNPAEPNQALIDAAERLKGKELFKESNDRARKILSEIKSLPIQERSYSEEEVKDIMAETWIRCVGNNGNDFKELRDKILEQFKNK